MMNRRETCRRCAEFVEQVSLWRHEDEIVRCSDMLGTMTAEEEGGEEQHGGSGSQLRRVSRRSSLMMLMRQTRGRMRLPSPKSRRGVCYNKKHSYFRRLASSWSV